MYTVQRIYDFHTLPEHSLAVFIDRLYPRGIKKERMAGIIWLKDLTPSTNLRRWYHADPDRRRSEFASRYLAELQQPAAQAALVRLKTLAAQHTEIRLLTAVKSPENAHVGILLEYLGQPFAYPSQTTMPV